MNCFSHSDTACVATCLDCGKGLCVTCASYYKLPICNTCHGNLRREAFKEIIKELLTVLLLGALVMFLGTSFISNEELERMMLFSTTPYYLNIKLHTF
jgi:hypothetical protein